MIRWQNLVLKYGSHTVLESAAGAVDAASFTCLVGKNGSGKSTLLRVLAGIAPPAKGKVQIGGAALQALHPEQRARLVSYFPQTRPVPQMDVLSMVRHGRFPHLGFSKILRPQDHAAIDHAVSLTNIGGLLEKDLRQLSGGERQRVYLAMMVAQDAQVMLLDEPATFLDIDYQQALLGMIGQLHRAGKTIVMVAHDLVQAFSCATHITLIQRNKELVCMQKEEMLLRPFIEETFGVAVQRDAENSLFGFRLAKGETQ